MPFTVTMPKLSPTMDTGTIAKWHKKEGDQVEPGEVLLEIATDKATVEHNALDGGWLRKIVAQEGDEVRVNRPIAVFTAEKGESIKNYTPEGIEEEKEAVPAAEGEAEPKKKEAPKEAVRQKAAGMLQPSFVPEPPLEDYTFEVPVEPVEKRLKASPLARKLAKEQSLDITTVKGSGPGGRIMSQDLEQAQKGGPVAFGHRELPKVKPGTYEEETLTQMRKVICQRLQESKAFIPHFWVAKRIDAEPLSKVREQLKNTGIVVSYNDFVVRACALALREHPNVNGGFDSEKMAIIRFKTIDIAVAVSLKEGLITPIVRHADFKNLGEISVEIRNLAKKARDGKLAMHEFKGGSFTISNLGMYGVTSFQAIINPPQAAILAVSGILNEPVVKNGNILPGKVMNLTLSADHRVIDGVAAAEFLNTVQKFLENPAALIV